MDAGDKLHCLIPQVEIAATVSRLASEITGDYQERTPLLVGILKGSFIFLSDLVRRLDFPLEIEFVRLSSYGAARQSSGRVEVIQGLSTPVAGRHVLVVEDIIDTGLTLSFFMDYLRGENPASLKLCSLLDKPSRRQAPVNIDYLGFTVPDQFLVGYGLDCNEQYRQLAEICVLEE